ncbi:unnamed protein product, partial [Linum tenue]
ISNLLTLLILLPIYLPLSFSSQSHPFLFSKRESFTYRNPSVHFYFSVPFDFCFSSRKA